MRLALEVPDGLPALRQEACGAVASTEPQKLQPRKLGRDSCVEVLGLLLKLQRVSPEPNQLEGG